jgi:thioredoxin-like negative regulator of GroEL
MAQAVHAQGTAAEEQSAVKPRLIFFHSKQSGRCRRVEAFLAQVLQRGHNHDTFTLYRVDADDRQDLVERFKIKSVPTLLVVSERRVAARVVSPRGCREIEQALAPWLM